MNVRHPSYADQDTYLYAIGFVINYAKKGLVLDFKNFGLL